MCTGVAGFLGGAALMPLSAETVGGKLTAS